MLRKLAAGFTAVLALVLVSTLQGCVEYEQDATLHSNGMGKLVIRLSMKKEIMDMMEKLSSGEDGEVSGELTDPKTLAMSAEGVAAWLPGEQREEDGNVVIESTAYFEDISKVKIYDMKGGPISDTEMRRNKISLEFEHEESDGTHKLSVTHLLADETLELLGLGGPNPKRTPKGQGLEMVKEMMAGMKIGFSIELPGEVTEVRGLVSEGRTAGFEFDDTLMFEAMENPESEAAQEMKKIAGSEGRYVHWKAGESSEEALSAFLEEFEAAKETWARLLADEDEPGEE